VTEPTAPVAGESRRLYLVHFELQRAQINAWCWGKGCGKGIVGAIDLGPNGSAIPCREPNCPHLDRQMVEPMGTLSGVSQGEPVYLRKLLPVTPESTENR